MTDNPLVSCLCVTYDRVSLLRRAVRCFLNQTYPVRELVVVCESDDHTTRDYLGSFCEPSIHSVEVPASPRLTLGALRNLAIERSRGEFVAQWDDDDWYAPSRLAEQVSAIRSSGKQGCVLLRQILYDSQTRTSFVSERRTWEGSLVVARAALPSYPDVSQAEDTALVSRLLGEGRLVGIDRPQLYVYVYHGRNTWDRSHWETSLLPYCSPLGEELSKKVRILLGETANS